MDIAELNKQFEKEYEFLYTHDNVAGEDEAVAWFDANQNRPDVKPYVIALVKYRGDLISSDREAAAFAFACEVLNIG